MVQVGVGCFSVWFGLAILPALASTNLSTWVYPGSSGRILQQPDALGNRVLDYTSVGYKSGTVPIPEVPVKVTVSPVAGDDTASIQAAINIVKALPLDPNGFRGAVLLTAGEYQVGSTITINGSGVVLRGVGSETNGTVLRATATNAYSLIRVTGSGSAATVSGTTRNITNNYVAVGATSFQVDSTSGLAAGDRVFVRRNANQQWIDDLGMNLLENPWSPGSYIIDADRIITRIEGNRIFINAPITCAIEQRYGGGTIRKYTWAGRIQNCGVEHLRGVSDFVAADDEDHGWILVQFNSVENAWADNVTSQYFGYACVTLYSGTRFTTVRDCRSLDPVSVVTGGRRYAFVLDDTQLCLVQNCYTHDDRHQFVTQSLTTGPNVFVDGLSDTARSDAGPHHRWGTGAIWDCVRVNGHQLNVRNRGNSGTGHGWAGGNEVVWNCQASSYVVQNPPTARNWLIGSVGTLSSSTSGAVGPAPPGTYDSHGSNVFPNSLYYAQLQDRLAAPNLQTREYWLGEINRFTNNVAPGESVPVDSAWQATVASVAGGAGINGFDVVANNQWVPFTFNFTLAPNEQVVAATLSVALRAASSASANDVLYLDSTNNALPLASLGWTSISTTTNPTVKVLDLSGQLGLLTDGKLNVAFQNDVGVDWALLQLQVAPILAGGTNVIYPVADATVRGGASANSNFGTATTLTVKEDTSNDNDRKAVLRWDLTSITGTVYQARIRLTPLTVGTDGIEQGVAFTTNDTWSENAVTWNNQPFAGRRFATWIPGPNVPLEFVVTPQVVEALAGDEQLSLQLYSIRNFGANGNVDYASREHPNVDARPQLRLFMAGSPPTISDITNRTAGVGVSIGPMAFTIGDVATPAADLDVVGSSSNTNLVPNANLIFGGSGSNRTVTVTPAANQSGITTITVTVTDGDGLSASDAFTLTIGNHAPGVFIWNGPGAGLHNWSTMGNWNPAGPPEAFDDVKFLNAGAGGVAVSNVNNVVDATFGGTIASLQFGNTNGNHTTLIQPGHTLKIIGSTGLTVGTETDNGNTQAVNATITGSGGALNVSGSNLILRQAADASGGSRATLDLSGLDAFSANFSRMLVGTEGAIARPAGTLLLARTNSIVASGSSPAIAIGGAGGGSGNAGGASHVHLGKVNAIFADSISVGRVKQGLSGGQASSLRFNPSFTNANPLLGPTAGFRAADGLNRIASWNIADSQSQGGTVNTAGICDFTGGVVDALVNTMIVARSSTGSGNGNPVGTFTLHAGTVDVNTLQIGVQGSASANGGTNSATGTVNVNGGMLVVNSSLQLGVAAGGAGAAATKGLLNIIGGTVRVNSISSGSGVSNAIAMNDGTLILSNTVPGSDTFGGTISLQGLNTFGVHGTSLLLANPISGSGSLLKLGPGALVLNASSSYLGSTLVNAGTLALTNSGSISSSSGITIASGAVLDVSGRFDGTLAIASGRTLSGNGTINGSLTVNPNATVSPGASIGALTVTNVVMLQGTAVMELNKAANTNDVIRGAASIVFGGTLYLTNLGGALVAGDSFTLFNAASYAGSFISIVPAQPASGLAWDSSGLITNGVLRIMPAARPMIESATKVGNDFVLSGTGGIPNGVYYVLSSTNLGTAVAVWPRVATNMFNGSGGFEFGIIVDLNASARFFLLQLP